MIRNDDDLQVFRAQLALIEEALEALRKDLLPKNERNFAVLSEGYVEMIDKLRDEINAYLEKPSERLNRYRDIIERILRDLAKLKYAHGDIDRMAVIDRAGDHYLLMIAGWDQKRVHDCIVHVDIIDGKFWIQRDGTEDGVTLDLEAAGVPKEHVVLAFKDPSIRPHTGYAVA